MNNSTGDVYLSVDVKTALLNRASAVSTLNVIVEAVNDLGHRVSALLTVSLRGVVSSGLVMMSPSYVGYIKEHADQFDCPVVVQVGIFVLRKNMPRARIMLFPFCVIIAL